MACQDTAGRLARCEGAIDSCAHPWLDSLYKISLPPLGEVGAVGFGRSGPPRPDLIQCLPLADVSLELLHVGLCDIQALGWDWPRASAALANQDSRDTQI